MNTECKNIVQDILDNKKFQSLKTQKHHGITRYDHLCRVTIKTYSLCKLFNLKGIREVTRAALLHDFYLDSELTMYNSAVKLNKHPNKALENSMEYFELNDMQKDIIKSHMFPLTFSLPKCKESWLVSLVDKVVGTYEFIKFKIPMKVNTMVFYVVTLVVKFL